MHEVAAGYLIALVIGLLLFLMSGFPVAFILGGFSLLLAVIGSIAGVFDTSLLIAMPARIFAAMNNDILLAVPLFVFMGTMLERSGIAAELLDGIGRLFGKRRGGLGYAVTIVGALLAASTGIVGATVTTMALLSLPIMLKWGYSKRLASGMICSAGTLGQIIPPSLVLVLLADTISSAYQKAQLEQGNFAPETVSISDLFAGAIIPGVVLVSVYLIYQFVLTIVRPDVSPAPPADESDISIQPMEIISRLVPPLTLIVGVLGSILAGVATPTESAAIGAIGALLIAGFGREKRREANKGLMLFFAAVVLKMAILPALNIRGLASQLIMLVPMLPFTVLLINALLRLLKRDDLSETCAETARTSGMVFMILIGAATLSLVFRGFGGEEAVLNLINSVSGGPMAALVAVMLVIFILGFILDFIEIIFIIVPTIAPVLLMAGIDPIWLAILISMNLQTSFLTPPFGFSLFYYRSAAPNTITTNDIYMGVIPFILLQIMVLCLVAFIPDLATWLPYSLR